MATPTRQRPPATSAGPVAHRSRLSRRNVDSVLPTISTMKPSARTRRQTRHSSVSSTSSLSRRRSTALSQRVVLLRNSSLRVRRIWLSTTVRSYMISTRSLRPSSPSDGPRFPLQFRLPQPLVSGFSRRRVTERSGRDNRQRRLGRGPRRACTTRVALAFATSRTSRHYSTTPAMRRGWFQRLLSSKRLTRPASTAMGMGC